MHRKSDSSPRGMSLTDDANNVEICYNIDSKTTLKNLEYVEEEKTMEKMIRAQLYWNNVKQVLTNEKGQGMVEYGLILSLIAVVTIAALTLTGTNLTAMFNKAAGKIQ